MTLDEIKRAVEAGKTVHWSNKGYTVIKDNIGQWLIAYNRGGTGECYWGLTHQDEVTMNSAEDEFFLGKD